MKQNGQPGTVSKILWHFTGGPKWNSKTNRQAKALKPSADAYTAFKAILRSKTLRTGGYAELARVIVPERHRYDKAAGKVVFEKNVEVLVKSSQVCCLADIPIAHLRYHQTRYGRFAIGFHRDSAVHHGFNPVLYTLENEHLVRTLCQGLAELQSIDVYSAAGAASEIASFTTDLEHDDIEQMQSLAEEAESYMGDIEHSVEDSHASFKKVLAFVKTFAQNEFSTIYCEREWRSISAFTFGYDDIAMLVLPHRVGRNKFYSEFISDQIKRLKLPRRIPVVPWEDLVEH